MMLRRLYFLFPNPSKATVVIDELSRRGVSHRRMHVLSRSGGDLGDLPPVGVHQGRDRARQLETLLWDGNLGLFFLALALLLVALYLGWALLAVLMAAAMAVTFLLGLRATWLPDVHLDEFRDALSHGEVLLMVDVPKARVAEIEDRVHRHHPEAAVGGVGWSLAGLEL
jgi:hypothetical protein